MADNRSPDYKRLYLQEVERRKQEEERRRRAEEEGRRDRERNQQTTFPEFIRYCHDLLSRPLKVASPSCSTTGTIPLPKGKFCPTRLRPWLDCPSQQQGIYESVIRYLQPSEAFPARLFAPLIVLEDLARRFALRPISSEQGLETYERIAVEDHVRDIITELCKIPAARGEFRLGDGVWFDNHTNALSESEVEVDATYPSDVRRPRPDQFCLHRVDGNTNSLLLIVEYKPPHKLSVENLRAGLRPMELWEELVRKDTIPTDPAAKLQYNAERMATSAVVQAYDAMIQEGCAYSILTNGLARVLLYIPYDDPATLYYYLCEPNREIDEGDGQIMQQPKTSVDRELCLCLMSSLLPLRDQKWRNSARSQLHVWETSFDHARSLIPTDELQQVPPHCDSSTDKYVNLNPSSSEYQPSSPPTIDSPTVTDRRMPTRSQAGYATSDRDDCTRSGDSPGPETDQTAGRKRGFSQVASSSPSSQRAARQQETGDGQGTQPQYRGAEFCTQRCLRGLQSRGVLDDSCPNVLMHRQSSHSPNHPINSEGLVSLLKTQLDEDIDRCLPLGICGGYGALFKLTCARYGYTVIGKGTTSERWKEVSREVEVYKVLQRVQGFVVPVFLGAINLEKIYFLHGAGQIRHMLVMGWGGKSITSKELEPWIEEGIKKSNAEIRAIGVQHDDLRIENVLWNEERSRVFIIDFHGCILRHPILKETRRGKRRKVVMKHSGI